MIQHVHVEAQNVHSVLRKHMLVDGMDFVLDYERSHESYMVDKVTGKEFLDFFSFFASQPIGYNHPAMHDESFEKSLIRVGRLKPSCSDVYTEEYASFLETFSRVGIRDHFKYAFFIAGGALAVENSLKTAFDWKVRKNMEKGRGEKGSKAIHFRHAFHGRTGYTLSLTNTNDPRKYQYFPQFDWPRIDPPVMSFPFDDTARREVELKESVAIKAIEQAFEKRPDDIAAIILEPIQAEGGDHHLRPEFLQALRDICDREEALLIFDEVQTGVGITGQFWAWEGLGVKPDILCFGKKMQVCGILSTERVDEVHDNVFHMSSRLNSTWGPDCVDMVRSQRYLEIIESENLLTNVRARGDQLLEGLRQLANHHEVLSQARGRGLLCAIDADSPERRDRIIDRCLDHGVLALSCGERTIRTRPFLNVSADEVKHFLHVLDQASSDSGPSDPAYVSRTTAMSTGI